MGVNGEVLGRPLQRWVAGVHRHPRLVLLLAAALTAVLGVYSARNLGVDTDTSKMFAEDLAFRRNQAELKAAFPQFVDTLLVVVDAPTADGARGAAERLAARLAEEEELFLSVDLPSSHPWFRTNGLLFLPTAELRALVEKLRPLQLWLAFLRRGPSLAEFFESLRTGLALRGDELPREFMDVLEGVGNAARGEREGDDYSLAWSEIFVGAGGPAASTRAVILTRPTLDYSSFVPARAAIRRVRELAAELPGNVRVRMTGEVALAHEELGQARDGAVLAGLLSLVLVTIFLWVGLRSPRLVIASLLTLLAGLVWTAGFAAVTVGHLNLISVAFAALYISLGVAFAIHYGLRFAELCVEGHWADALEETANDVGTSLFVAASTTAVGFLAFVPTDFVGVAELGVIAGGGVMISLFASLTVLPALLSVRVLQPRFTRIEAALHPPDARSRALQAFIHRHAVGVRLGAILVGAASLLGLTAARFDPDPLHLRSPHSESVQTFEDLAQESLTTPYRIEALMADGAAVDALRPALEALDEVSRVLALEDFVPHDQDAKLAILGELREILGAEPTARATRPGLEVTTAAVDRLRATLAAQAESSQDDRQPVAGAARELGRLLAHLDGLEVPDREQALAGLEQRLLGGLTVALGRLREATGARAVGVADVPADLRARWVAGDGRRRVSVVPAEDLRDAAARERFVEAVVAHVPAAAGSPVVISGTGRVAVRSFQKAFACALGAITLIMLVLLRRPLDVTLLVGLLLLTGAVTAEVAVLLGIDFNFANLIALPLLLGMGVDNGVHMLHRWRSGKLRDGNMLGTSTARAVLFASLTTLGGFGTLAISPHPGTASMGLLLTIGIGATLLCTLVVLPATLAGRAMNGEP